MVAAAALGKRGWEAGMGREGPANAIRGKKFGGMGVGEKRADNVGKGLGS